MKSLLYSFLFILTSTLVACGDSVPLDEMSGRPSKPGPGTLMLTDEGLNFVKATKGVGENRVHSPDDIQRFKKIVKRFPFNTGSYSKFLLQGPYRHYSACKSGGEPWVTFQIFDKFDRFVDVDFTGFFKLQKNTRYILEVVGHRMDCLSYGFGFDIEAYK